MKIAISLEHRFYKCEDHIYDNTVYGYSFWEPYLREFDEIFVIARVQKLLTVDKSFKRTDGNKVTFIELYDYRNNFKSIGKLFSNIGILINQSRHLDGVIIRTPCFMGYFLWVLLLIRKIPYSVELVGDILDIANTLTSKKKKIVRKIFIYRLVRCQCQKANLVSYVTDEYLQKKYPASNSLRMYGWSDIQLSSDSVIKISKEYSHKKELKFIYTANFAFYKGHDLLIEIFNQLNKINTNWKLVLIGDGPNRKKTEFLINKFNLNDKIILTGVMPNEEVIKHLEMSDIYISASLTEGLPRAVIEAISKGLPVVGFDVGGMSEIVEKDYLAPPKDMDKLLAIIINLFNNKVFLDEISFRNIQRSFHYTLERTLPIRLKTYKVLKEDICNSFIN